MARETILLTDNATITWEHQEGGSWASGADSLAFKQKPKGKRKREDPEWTNAKRRKQKQCLNTQKKRTKQNKLDKYKHEATPQNNCTAMCICVYIYMYIIYVHIHIRIHIHTHIHIHTTTCLSHKSSWLDMCTPIKLRRYQCKTGQTWQILQSRYVLLQFKESWCISRDHPKMVRYSSGTCLMLDTLHREKNTPQEFVWPWVGTVKSDR